MLKRAYLLKPIACFSLLILFFCLSSCGFHLRNQGLQLPVKTLTIEPDAPFSPLQRVLRQQIKLASSSIVANQNKVARLVLFDESFHEQELALARDAHVQAYLIVYEVKFSIYHPDGTLWSGPNTIRVSREITNDLNTVLGQNIERELLDQHLRERASFQIIEQIAALH